MILYLGNPFVPAFGENIDIRTDVPRYKIFKNGQLVSEKTDISK